MDGLSFAAAVGALPIEQVNALALFGAFRFWYAFRLGQSIVRGQS